MLKSKRILTAFILLTIIIVSSLIASMMMSDAAGTIYGDQRLFAPSAEFLFGTDHFGRDLFARTLVAAKVSIYVGGIVALLSTIIGTGLGLISGYYRAADFVLMRVIDGFLAFPSLLLALALVAALGGSLTNIIIALTFTFSPLMARIVRSSVLQVSNVQYIEAAKVTGVHDIVIMTRYILPNILTPIIVQGTFVFAKAILAEAALSFLGVGIDPTLATWGNMLQESQIYLSVAPWTSIFPGLAIVVTVFALNLFGDGVRDVLNPQSYTRRVKKNKKSVRKTKPIQA